MIDEPSETERQAAYALRQNPVGVMKALRKIEIEEALKGMQFQIDCLKTELKTVLQAKFTMAALCKDYERVIDDYRRQLVPAPNTTHGGRYPPNVPEAIPSVAEIMAMVGTGTAVAK